MKSSSFNSTIWGECYYCLVSRYRNSLSRHLTAVHAKRLFLLASNFQIVKPTTKNFLHDLMIHFLIYSAMNLTLKKFYPRLLLTLTQLTRLPGKGNNGFCCWRPIVLVIALLKTFLSRWHTWRFYTPIAANLIASKNRERFLRPIDADTLGDFFRRSQRCDSFKNSCDKIAQPDRLTLLAIRSIMTVGNRGNGHTWRIIAGVFNRRYLTCQTSAILYADRGDRHITWYKIAKCVAGFRRNVIFNDVLKNALFQIVFINKVLNIYTI